MNTTTGSFRDRYGPWAVVTGASRGLGAEYARQLAARGLNLVLVARSAGDLADLAGDLQTRYGSQTRTVALDLSQDGFLEPLQAVTTGLEVGLLVSNAALSTVGPLLSRDQDQLVRQLHLNARAGLILVRHYGALMVTRGRGGVILLSSGSALHGTPWSANYAGTKAYNLMLAEALWYEWHPLGVDVLGVMAGVTRTPGWQANQPKPDRLVPVMEAAPVVAKSLQAL
ncbi:MAG: SDR family NAD(P)-dependent oxidoreductase, partial [Bifidobacteriaceae bacterium]|nr:SDR family NAD(P)-dependent oxidoreductase [Bifidobacteriaceae bacterium]